MRGWLLASVSACFLCGALLAAEEGEGGRAPDKAEVRTLVNSGRELLGARKTTEAIAVLEKAVRVGPESQEAGFLLAAAYIEAGRYEEAGPILESLLNALPDNPMVKNNLAWVYVKSKDASVRNPAKAVTLARAAVLDAPSDYLIWNTLAEAYYADGRYDRALRAAESALRLNILAGVTNTVACQELVSRCRKAAGDAGKDKGEELD